MATAGSNAGRSLRSVAGPSIEPTVCHSAPIRSLVISGTGGLVSQLTSEANRDHLPGASVTRPWRRLSLSMRDRRPTLLEDRSMNLRLRRGMTAAVALMSTAQDIPPAPPGTVAPSAVDTKSDTYTQQKLD